MPTNFITYAQNAEDVMLWRALRRVEHGFYIDVGAQDPVVDSVTKAFYERGWRGINIEPVHHWYERLIEDRVHDINLCVAASDHAGEMRLFEVEDTGLSTSNPNFAQQHRESGWGVRERTVPCITLDAICDEHDVGVVHFLKVDCEGAEQQTLSGLSLKTVRPWIVLVEATEPRSTKQTWMEWEHLLTDRGYEFTYFDGLNRFYLAKEHGELRSAFDTPPNPLDWAVRAVEIRSRESADRLTDQLAQFRSVERTVRAEAERDQMRVDNERLRVELKELQRSQQELRRVLEVCEQRTAEVASERDRIRNESDRRATELEARKVEIDIGKAELKARKLELDAGKVELEARKVELEALRGIEKDRQVQMDALQATRKELANVRHSSRDLQRRIDELLASHSWRVTAPLRLCGHGIRQFRELSLSLIYRVLRPFAHAGRPALRWSARRKWIRGPVTRAFGRHSRLVNTARLFLFGSPPFVSPEAESSPNELTGLGQQSGSARPQNLSRSESAVDGMALSERGRVVKRLMDETTVDVSKEHGHAHRS